MSDSDRQMSDRSHLMSMMSYLCAMLLSVNLIPTSFRWPIDNMFASTARGFKDVPVTKLLISYTALMPLVVSIFGVQYLFDLAISPHIRVWHQWWRILANQMLFVDQSEVLLALVLLYNLRAVERLLGSRKYLSLVIVLFGLNTLFIPVILQLAYSILGLRPVMPASQSAVIIGLISLYHSLVPVVYKFKISPIAPSDSESSRTRRFNTLTFSDKDFLYFLAFQLALFFPAGPLYSFVGWTTCKLVYAEILPGKNWRVPFYDKFGLEKMATTSYLAHAESFVPPQTAAGGGATEPDSVEASENDTNDTAEGTPEASENRPSRPFASQLLDTFRT